MKIVSSDNPILHKKINISTEKKAFKVGTKLIRFIKNKNTVGLAANQVGVSERVFIAKVLDGDFKVFVDPVIVKTKGIQKSHNEGCVSFLGQYVKSLKRPRTVTISYLENGERVTRIYSNFYATIICHEVDHLNGITIIDRANEQGATVIIE